ncbi:hypothetical protein [Runella aurantiaca]|uniref:Uncharacterized protein n=1 Tax=Runella aurantiaca TaxID=2282308 RepID=A0A369IEZ8_9BACT|nr:hypothetical protein [Runella aurantiaca]RDB06073.1 hypothetical protein DVG78_09545 [Runella aurantiaca]
MASRIRAEDAYYGCIGGEAHRNFYGGQWRNAGDEIEVASLNFYRFLVSDLLKNKQRGRVLF